VYVRGGFWLAGERDVYASLFIIAAIYIAAKHSEIRVRTLGLLSGIPLVIRPTYALIPIAFAAWVYWTGDKRSRLITALKLLLFAAIPVGSVLILYLFDGG